MVSSSCDVPAGESGTPSTDQLQMLNICARCHWLFMHSSAGVTLDYFIGTVSDGHRFKNCSNRSHPLIKLTREQLYEELGLYYLDNKNKTSRSWYISVAKCANTVGGRMKVTLPSGVVKYNRGLSLQPVPTTLLGRNASVQSTSIGKPLRSANISGNRLRQQSGVAPAARQTKSVSPSQRITASISTLSKRSGVSKPPRNQPTMRLPLARLVPLAAAQRAWPGFWGPLTPSTRQRASTLTTAGQQAHFQHGRSPSASEPIDRRRSPESRVQISPDQPPGRFTMQRPG